MTLSESDIDFLSEHHSAAMLTVAWHREGVAGGGGSGRRQVVEQRHTERVRTQRLRRDRRCTVFVFDAGFSWLALDTSVAIVDGHDAAEQNVRLFRAMQHKPSDR